MPRNEATEAQRVQHGWCLALRASQAFLFYLAELQKRSSHAHGEVCAETPRGTREFQAGRLSAFAEAAQIIERKYKELAPIVEIV